MCSEQGLGGKRSCLMDKKKSSVQLKRPHEGEQQNRASSTVGSSGHKLAVRKGKISAVDAGQGNTNLSQQCLNIRSSENLSSMKPVSVVYPGIFLIFTIECANIMFKEIV